MSRQLYVEVSPLLTPHLTGIGRFVARLVEALAQAAPLRLVNTIQADLARSMRLSTDLPCGQEIPVEPGDLPGADRDIEEWRRDLLRRRHVPHDAALAARSPGLFTLLRPADRHFAREISILYDFTPLLVPWAHVPETREHFGIFFSQSARLTDHAVAISHSTRWDASWLCALDPRHVVVGYPGPSLCARTHAHPWRVQRQKQVILVVSTLEPRKNAQFLMQWFLETDVLAPGTELWWAGPDGWLWNAAPSGRRRNRRQSVKFLGMVSDARLCELYRAASFTIYPSLYEGFGFPVLDSLLHGTPVVSSFNSSLAEFAGPGVFYFDPCDPRSLDAACRELLATPPLDVVRDDLRERCSWDRLASVVLSLSDARHDDLRLADGAGA